MIKRRLLNYFCVCRWGDDMKKKSISPILVITSLCILMHIVFIVCGNLQWETNDDEVLNLIAAGAWGIESSHHLVYQHILIGWICRVLYSILPGINVYAVGSLILNSFSVCMLCGLFAKKHSLPMAVFVTVVLNLVLFNDFFQILQYTKNAFLYAVTGWVYLFYGIKESNLKQRFAGYCFLAVSFMVRWHSCLFTLPFVFFLFCTEGKGIYRSALKRAAVTAVLFAGLAGINAAANQGQWNDYVRYNDVRTDLLDFGFPDYSEHAEELKNAGISENDFEVMRQWNYGDNKVFTYENIQLMDSMKSKPFFSFSAVTESLGDIYTLTHTSFFPAVLFALIGICVLLKDSKRLIAAIGYLLVILLEYVVLHNNMRLVWRVELGIWIVPIAFLLLFFKDEHEHTEYHRGTVVTSLVVSIGIALMCESQLAYNFLFRKHGQIVMRNEENRCAVIDAFYEAYPNAYLLGDTTSFSAYSVRVGSDIFDITRSKYADKFDRFSFLGGWIYPSPVVRDSQSRAGIENPIEHLLDDNVYFGVLSESFYGTETECLKTFLQEHYATSVSYKVVDQIGEIDIVKFSKG